MTISYLHANQRFLVAGVPGNLGLNVFHLNGYQRRDKRILAVPHSTAHFVEKGLIACHNNPQTGMLHTLLNLHRGRSV